MSRAATDPPTAVLRAALEEPGELLVAPVAFNALTARLVESCGFPLVYVGGYTTGASLCVPEPLLGRTDLTAFAAEIARRTTLPVLVDGGAGFGEPMHTAWLVRELAAAGLAGTHVEDQAYPKRAHYHRDYREHVVDVGAMVDKIVAAREAAAEVDPAFVLIARTDAMRTDGYEEGVARANAYLDAGADAVMVFPNDAAEAARAPADVGGPVVYVNSWGNRVGRPILGVAEAELYGYRMLVDAQGALLAAVEATRDTYRALAERGRSFDDPEHGVALRRELEELVGLEQLYALEERTVEKR
jgi:methylisocitrate lyase